MVIALADKRGPATVAQSLYEETSDSIARRQQRSAERRVARPRGRISARARRSRIVGDSMRSGAPSGGTAEVRLGAARRAAPPREDDHRQQRERGRGGADHVDAEPARPDGVGEHEEHGRTRSVADPEPATYVSRRRSSPGSPLSRTRSSSDQYASSAPTSSPAANAGAATSSGASSTASWAAYTAPTRTNGAGTSDGTPTTRIAASTTTATAETRSPAWSTPQLPRAAGSAASADDAGDRRRPRR